MNRQSKELVEKFKREVIDKIIADVLLEAETLINNGACKNMEEALEYQVESIKSNGIKIRSKYD